MNWLLIKAVIKARKNGLLHLVPAKVPTHFECLKDRCHKCCSNLGSPVITPEEAGKISSDSIQKDKKAMFIKAQDCVCCLLKDGLCSIYENRPRGCREYPWYNIDGRLYCDAGCPGIKHDIDDRPNVEDIQPFENFFPGTPKILIWLIKRICTKK
jgi:Fe-S-cluster containining protein